MPHLCNDATLFLQVANHLYSNYRANLQSFLTASSDQASATGSLRGALWEGLCHTQMQKGEVKMTRREILPNASKQEQEIALEAKHSLLFKTLSQITTAKFYTYARFPIPLSSTGYSIKQSCNSKSWKRKVCASSEEICEFLGNSR